MVLLRGKAGNYLFRISSVNIFSNHVHGRVDFGRSLSINGFTGKPKEAQDLSLVSFKSYYVCTGIDLFYLNLIPPMEDRISNQTEWVVKYKLPGDQVRTPREIIVRATTQSDAQKWRRP